MTIMMMVTIMIMMMKKSRNQFSDTEQWGDQSQSSQAGQTYNWSASERTPCISVTAPDNNEEEGKRKEEEVLRIRGRLSMDSGYSSPLCPALPPLSPHHLDVSL